MVGKICGEKIKNTKSIVGPNLSLGCLALSTRLRTKELWGACWVRAPELVALVFGITMRKYVIGVGYSVGILQVIQLFCPKPCTPKSG
jgi:hypothetical protein